jgi:hypothetical protein
MVTDQFGAARIVPVHGDQGKLSLRVDHLVPFALTDPHLAAVSHWMAARHANTA